MSEVPVVEHNDIATSTNVSTGSRKGRYRRTDDFKNGSPRDHEKSWPVLFGGSVATSLLASHVSAPPLALLATKSRGSTGNIFPPIWNVSVCGAAHGNVGGDVDEGVVDGEMVE